VNKIAAGEVIERPVSVVKEFVENSIDAGASKILIEVSEGGKRLIRVADDGCGMDREDVVLAFEKHATSKISGVDDLDRIATLGFRGEALSSISSVARSVEVRTKTKSVDPTSTGTGLTIEDGKIQDVSDIGCPVGTAIEVRDLFYNVPARRKYLKSARSELAKITDLVTSYAIINYQISFELFTGKKTVFKSLRSESWDNCVLRILGSDAARSLIPIEARSENVSISGAVGKHTFTRSSPDWIMIYVNGRPVRSKSMVRAVNDAYRTLIPRGKHPIAVISLQIDPSQLDVNVHPAKTEVRFLREEELAEMLTETISRELLSLKDTEFSSKQMAALQLQVVEPYEVEPCNIESSATTSQGVEPGQGQDSDRGMGVESHSAEVRSDKIATSHNASSESEKLGAKIQKILPFTSMPERLEIDLDASIDFRVMGQILKLYIVIEGPDGLVLVDQHAAAERIEYEKLQKKHRSGTLAQELIVPLNLELSPREQVMLEDWNPFLNEMGFEIVPFGGNAYNVRSVPAVGSKLESSESIHDVLKDLFDLGKVSTEATTRDDVLKLFACRGSIKAGHELTWKDMQVLLRDLLACQNPKTCPHGRPTMVTISPLQLEKIFGRR